MNILILVNVARRHKMVEDIWHNFTHKLLATILAIRPTEYDPMALEV